MAEYFKLPKELGGLTGMVTGVDGKWVWLNLNAGKRGYSIKILREDMEPAGAPSPPEPGHRAVVLDRAGVAWQHMETAWRSMAGMVTGWENLWTQYGPVTLLREASDRPQDYWDPDKESPKINWVDQQRGTRGVVWSGFTKAGDSIQVEKSFAIGQRRTEPIVRLRFRFIGKALDTLTFTPEAARNLAKALKQAAGTKS